MNWIIVAGNLSDGFAFFGPFDDLDQALAESERIGALNGVDTWVATLSPREDESK